MSKILKKHKKSNIRFQDGDLILYEPSKQQSEEIKQLIQDNSKIDENLNINGELLFKNIRFIIRELTSIGSEIDDMEDEEVKIAFEDGDRALQKLISAITDLVNEIAEDIFNDYMGQIKLINSYVNIINSTKDLDKIKEKINKLFKKSKAGITFDDLSNLNIKDEDAIKDFLEKVNK